MRHFEDIEKNIITVLIANEKKDGLNCLSNILEDHKINFFNQEVTYFFSIQNNIFLTMNTFDNISNITPDALNSLNNFVNKNMLIIINLFKYLSENNYIVHTNANFGTQFNMGMVIVGQQSNSISFVSPSIMPDFIVWAREQFYITPKLQTLVDNNFVEESEKKYQDQLDLANKQTKVAFCGFLVTLLALVISTGLQIFQITDKEAKQIEIINKSFDVNNTNEIDLQVHDLKIETINKLDKQQFHLLLKSIQDLNNTCFDKKKSK